MSREVSPAAMTAILSQQTEEVFLVCLTLEHPEILETVRIVNDTQELIRSDGTYQPFPFEAQIPGDSEDSVPRVSIVFDNVSLEIQRLLKDIQNPPKVTMFVVLASSPEEIELGPLNFSLLNAEYNVFAIRGQLGFEEDILSQGVPKDTYTPTNSPGLFA